MSAGGASPHKSINDEGFTQLLFGEKGVCFYESVWNETENRISKINMFFIVPSVLNICSSLVDRSSSNLSRSAHERLPRNGRPATERAGNDGRGSEKESGRPGQC